MWHALGSRRPRQHETTTLVAGHDPWLDANRPRVAFIFRMPFELLIGEKGMKREAVIPLGGQQRPARVAISRVASPALLNDAPLRYLSVVRGTDLPELESALVDTWVADVELDNRLEGEVGGWTPGELLFERALEALNRYLHAYMIASEDAAARFLTAQALDFFALAEFRRLDGSPLDSDIFTLPSAYQHKSAIDERALLRRLDYAVKAESQGHPIDDVVLWRIRAEHHLNFVGDYELSVLALQTSVERLLFAIASAIAVDKGEGADFVDQLQKKSFDALTKTLQHDLGGSWDRKLDEKPFGAYWQDLYRLRNQVGHAGRRVNFLEAARAFEVYRDLKEFVEDRVLGKVDTFPRTGMMLFGLQDLAERGRATQSVLDLDSSLRDRGQEWGWWRPPTPGSDHEGPG